MKTLWYRFFRAFRLDVPKLKFIVWWAQIHKGKYCWSDCVGWAINPDRFNPYAIDDAKGCEIESKDCGSCWCGGWVAGMCVDKMAESQINELRNTEEPELSF